ncbi:hypothetical protein HDU85_001394 [Gaertneriomyces sp. JEL0708]|nr:hypothetical protein HDU85_001394 [Gaertneriomyces sp. JEL0708]
MKVIRIDEPAQFDQVLTSTLESGSHRLFILFFGTEEVATGESWCPDCVIADPTVRKWIRTVEHAILLEVPVGGRSTWKNNPANFYRRHSLSRLTCVPTLIEVGPDGTEKKRLLESECNSEERLQEFLSP